MRTWLVGLALVSTLLLPAAASADPAPHPPAETLVLATESGEEAPGPDPRPANDENNPFAPEEYERPWTWWLGVVIFVPTILVVGLGALIYYVLVYRPRQASERQPARR